MRPERYPLLVAGFAALLIVLAASVSALVDPYDVIGMPRIAGFNATKPDAGSFQRLVKPYQAARMHPATLFLGSSRSLIGVNADSPAWPAALQPVYNYALSAQGMPTAELAFRDATAKSQIRHVFLQVDFEVFIYPEPLPATPGEEEARLLLGRDGKPNPGQPWQYAKDLLSVTLTMRALTDSVHTVLAQYRTGAGDLSAKGSLSDSEFRRAAQADGYGVLFAQKNALYVQRLAWLAGLATRQTGEMPGMAEVRRMLAYSRAHGIAFTLVIPPSHSDLLELYDRVGLWERFEAWKRALVAAVRTDGDDKAAVWDFSDYDARSTEAVPTMQDRRSTVTWFWEPLHFKKETGDMIVARLTGGGSPDFGEKLTPDTVEARIAAIRRHRDAFRAAHPEAMARIDSYFRRGP